MMRPIDAIPSPTDAELLARRRAALALALAVNCDVRTAERALVFGIHAIRGRRLREEMRAYLQRVRATAGT